MTVDSFNLYVTNFRDTHYSIPSHVNVTQKVVEDKKIHNLNECMTAQTSTKT